MSTRTVMLEMPESIWQRFQRTAEVTHQPVESVVMQSIRGNMPPFLEDDPPIVQRELEPLQEMEDQELWDIARSHMNKSQQRRYKTLLRKSGLGTITQKEQAELDQLGEQYDLYTLRKAFAYAVLRWRGFPLPDFNVSNSKS